MTCRGSQVKGRHQQLGLFGLHEITLYTGALKAFGALSIEPATRFIQPADGRTYAVIQVCYARPLILRLFGEEINCEYFHVTLWYIRPLCH